MNENQYKQIDKKEAAYEKFLSKKEKARNIKIVTFVGILTIIIIFLFVFVKCDPNTGTDISASHSESSSTISKADTVGEVKNGSMPNMTKEQIQAELSKQQSKDKFRVQISSGGTIQKGSKTLNLKVANPSTNEASCRIEILEGSEVLFGSTGFGNDKQLTAAEMKPDTYMDKFELNRELTPGQHSLTVCFHEMFNGQNIGTTNIQVNVSCA